MKKQNTQKFKIRTPLLVWDRECDFCQLCIERFHVFSGNRIALVPYQDLLGKFPKAPELDYKRSLVFFTTDIDGEETLESIAYIFPDDSPNEPTELANEGGSTTGKSWECNLFEITHE